MICKTNANIYILDLTKLIIPFIVIMQKMTLFIIGNSGEEEGLCCTEKPLANHSAKRLFSLFQHLKHLLNILIATSGEVDDDDIIR